MKGTDVKEAGTDAVAQWSYDSVAKRCTLVWQSENTGTITSSCIRRFCVFRDADDEYWLGPHYEAVDYDPYDESAGLNACAMEWTRVQPVDETFTEWEKVPSKPEH